MRTRPSPAVARHLAHLLCAAAFVCSALATTGRAQTGHILDAVGPVNQSMGGAGTALPLDAIGALYWNPASIAGLPSSEIGFGFQALAPTSQLASSVAPGALGPGAPPIALAGTTTSDGNIAPIPSMGFVCRPKHSRWSYGLGGFAIGGFGVDYPQSSTNPITSPQPPNGLGFGPINSDFQMMQLSGAIAYELTDRLSIGVALNGDWASLAVSPFSAVPPDDANGDGFPTYPAGVSGDAIWGMGFQAGLYRFNPETGIHLAAAVRSPQWFQRFRINGVDENGAARPLLFDLDYPLIVSVGVGYSGLPRWRFAADVRYIDYANTDGFQDAGFDAAGAVTGFGWRSIWTTAVGVEWRPTQPLALRAGYTFNENPIRDIDSFFNVHAPAIIQHHVGCGFSYETRHRWILSAAFQHGFANSISGPWHGASGPIAGTNVASRLATYSVSAGLSKRF